jgi:hypothetical protein
MIDESGGMNATSVLPHGYSAAGTITVKGNPRLVIGLNLAALPWAVLCTIFFLLVTGLLRPIGAGFTIRVSLIGLVAVFALTILLHEPVHGLVVWAYTGSPPRFGIGAWYAYASAPGWYLPRGPFLVVGLAPLLGLSAVGLAVVPFLPPASVGWVAGGLIVNAVGSIGDLYIAVRLLGAPARALIEDTGHTVTWYARTESVGQRPDAD